MSFDLQLQALLSDPKFFAAGVILLSLIAETLHMRRKRVWEGRAPMVSYLIPWVGSALEMGRDLDAFFNRTQKKYGDLFAVKTFGKVVTYVSAPSLISDIFQNSQSRIFVYLLIGLEFAPRHRGLGWFVR